MLRSTSPAVSSGEERGLISRTAAGNRAYCKRRTWKTLGSTFQDAETVAYQNLAIVQELGLSELFWDLVFLFFFFRRLGHSDVFNLIHQHNLFNSIQDKIIMLMEFDKEVIVMEVDVGALKAEQESCWLVEC